MPMKFREVLALLRRDGWMEVRQRRGHIRFTHPTKPGTITSAGKKNQEVPPGALNAMLKQAGLK
jgi:predicted RNA binding protein YcfA (HicA-like mRNA interferase family)